MSPEKPGAFEYVILGWLLLLFALASLAGFCGARLAFHYGALGQGVVGLVVGLGGIAAIGALVRRVVRSRRGT